MNTGHMVNIQNSSASIHERNKWEMKFKIPLSVAVKIIKYLAINLMQILQDKIIKHLWEKINMPKITGDRSASAKLGKITSVLLHVVRGRLGSFGWSLFGEGDGD